MTFTQILADCYRWLGFQTTPATAVQTRVKAFVNETHRELLTLPGMARLRDDTLAITTTANTARTALPKAVERIRAITDHTNNWRLRQIPLSDLRTQDPGRQWTGSYPERYAVVGWRQVAVQPSDASAVYAKSTAAGDTTQTLFVEGVRSGGAVSTASVTLTGTTAAAVGSISDFVEITKCYLSATAAGEVTLLEDSGAGTELARISIGDTDARYLTVEWDPIPTGAVTEYVDYTRNILDLVNDGDVPLLPVDFHRLLVLGVRKKEYELRDDDRYREVSAEYDRGVIALRSWVLNDADAIASLRVVPRGAVSQLGSAFPAGS